MRPCRVNLRYDVVDRGAPVGTAVPGLAAGSKRQREVGAGAVRELDVLVGEIDSAGSWQEHTLAVVTPAWPGAAREPSVLGEAVLRRLARVGDIDHRALHAVR